MTIATTAASAQRAVGPKHGSSTVITLADSFGPLKWNVHESVRTDGPWQRLLPGSASLEDAVAAAHRLRALDPSNPTETIVHKHAGDWLAARAQSEWMGERTVGWRGHNVPQHESRRVYMDDSARPPRIDQWNAGPDGMERRFASDPDAVVSDQWAFLMDRTKPLPVDSDGWVELLARPISEFVGQ